MLRSFISLFSPQPVVSHPMPEAQASSVTESSQSPIWVYIWRTTPEEGGNYLSFRSITFPSAGPFICLPLKAGSADSLETDMRAEVSALKMPQPELDCPYLSAGSMKQPDSIYKINPVTANLDVAAMNAEINRIKRESEQGNACYQLLPNVRLHRFFRAYAENPFSTMIENQQPLPADKLEIYNCTTSVKRVFKKGGGQFQKTPFHFPWGVTPNKLAEELKAFSPVEEVSLPAYTKRGMD